MNKPFEISKLDDSQCLVFGWANVSISKRTAAGAGGEEFFDLQEDSIAPSELEKAGYQFMLESRETDEMHDGPCVGQMIESLVFTPDKLEKMATDPVTGKVDTEALVILKRIFPTRWWVGFKLDKKSYAKVKSGEFKMFSIAGEAERVEV